jgi:hypothetical protein
MTRGAMNALSCLAIPKSFQSQGIGYDPGIDKSKHKLLVCHDTVHGALTRVVTWTCFGISLTRLSCLSPVVSFANTPRFVCLEAPGGAYICLIW